jgi:hypothetical protein
LLKKLLANQHTNPEGLCPNCKGSLAPEPQNAEVT